MSTGADFIAYVLDQAGLHGPEGLSARKMFGEYALYLRERVVALACDNQLFLKPTDAGRALLPQPEEGFPYPGAKPWWRLAELDDRELLRDLLQATADALPLPKPKKPRAARKTADARRAGPGKAAEKKAGVKVAKKAETKQAAAKKVAAPVNKKAVSGSA
ncbi:MAG: TfoX/Sxy family protein [Aquabacterium sp.]|nr:TfoX/Sxy family protein [Aquabacterium sp.]